MGLAGAGRAEQDDVLAAGEEVELTEMQDGVAAVSYTHLTLPTTPYV